MVLDTGLPGTGDAAALENGNGYFLGSVCALHCYPEAIEMAFSRYEFLRGRLIGSRIAGEYFNLDSDAFLEPARVQKVAV